MNNQSRHTSENSVVLYGISKVEYGANGCTPYPMCLKSCANYLGQDICIDFTMVSTGAAFRLAWDTTSWNGGNVDVIHTFDEPEEVYKLGVESLGRDFHILARATNPCNVKFNSSTKSGNKDDFIRFIKAQIDKGFPCIALGIIGPPESCIITGYRENGEVLLGWNFFQDGSEFASQVKTDESGYYITNKWWENECTVAVISMGEITRQPVSTRNILENAIKVMTERYDKKSYKIFANSAMIQWLIVRLNRQHCYFVTVFLIIPIFHVSAFAIKFTLFSNWPFFTCSRYASAHLGNVFLLQAKYKVVKGDTILSTIVSFVLKSPYSVKNAAFACSLKDEQTLRISENTYPFPSKL